MTSSSDEDDQVVTHSPIWKKRRSSAWDSPSSKHKSGDVITTSNSEGLVDSNITDQRSTARSRSVSEATRVNYKSQWASAIGAQESVQHSLLGLREAADRYEKYATQHRWDELLVVRKNVVDLEKLAFQSVTSEGTTRLARGLERFCSVALEYSKLLDVVMSGNQLPEYAGLAWGIMKVLLCANINHSKLKENVERYLISIGEQSALVNQFVYYSPTERMAETVGHLYADFGKFLRKAIDHYAKSKLATVFNAFTFPWERKFGAIVERINCHFQRIKDLCKASHYGTSLQNQHLLHTIWEGHREVHQAVLSGQDKEHQLRQAIQEDMKTSITKMLQSFDSKWVGRFDQLLQQHAALVGCTDGSTASKSPPALSSTDYLCNVVRSEQNLSDFRDRLYPGLVHFDMWEQDQNARGKNMTTYDFQHCAKLLAHPEVKTWMEKQDSGMIWINSHQITKAVDWISVLATDLIDHATHLEYITVLRHFSLGSYSDKTGSSPCVIVQSLIFQILSPNRRHFLNDQSADLIRQRFEDARQDLEQLWGIFLQVIKIAKINCAWIVLDHIDILAENGPIGEVLAFLSCLDDLVQDPSITVKVFVTARLCGSHHLSSLAGESGAISPRHPIINVPRGYHRHEALLWSRYSKKPHRLHESRPSNNREITYLAGPSDEAFEESSDDAFDYGQLHNVHVTKQAQTSASNRRTNSPSLPGTKDSDSASSIGGDMLLTSEADTTNSESPKRRNGHQVPNNMRYSSSDDTSDEDYLTLGKIPGIKKTFDDFAWSSDSGDDIPHTTLLGIPKVVVALPIEPAICQERRRSSLRPELDQNSSGLTHKSDDQSSDVKTGKKTVTFDSDYDDSDG